MIKPESNIPKWVESRYRVLWDKFKEEPFRVEEAEKVLEENRIENLQGINMLISELKKVGWLTIELDPKDSRKKNYRLKSKENIIKDIYYLNFQTL